MAEHKRIGSRIQDEVRRTYLGSKHPFSPLDVKLFDSKNCVLSNDAPVAPEIGSLLLEVYAFAEFPS